MTNPDNFVEHRDALMRLSVEMPALTAAWKVTGRKKYAEHAARHLRAWFVDGAPRMNPHLEYAQAIHGRSKGRGTGIIDTIHLVEVARAAPLVAESGALRSEEFAAVRKWFADYLRWMTTSASPEKLLQVNPPAPVLTAWVSAGVAPPSIVTDPPVSSTKSETVLRLPVLIQPSASGSTVRIDGAFNTLINGPAPLSIYDFGQRQWLSTNQPGDWTVGFQPPAQIGRVRPGRVTVSMDASAPLHVVSLKRGQVRAGKVVDNPAGEELGRWVKPVTPQTLSFKVGDEDVDEQGRVWLRLGIEPAGDGMSVSQWRMLDLRVSFDEAVVQ